MWEKLYYDFRKLNSFGLGFNIPFINLLRKIVDESIIRKINFLHSLFLFNVLHYLPIKEYRRLFATYNFDD